VDRCEECGFDPATVTGAVAIEAVKGFGRRYRAPLSRFLPGEDGPAILRARPAPDAWSAIEYAAHVRDVFGLFDRRVSQILAAGDHPELEVIDHAAAVAGGRYAELDPVVLVDALAAAADGLAERLASVTGDDWSRWGTRQGEPRTVLEIAQRGVHEGNHHLLDIGRSLRAARQGPTTAG
jgi:hypothetical protein